MDIGFKEYGVYHVWYGTTPWKNSYVVCKTGVVKTYGNNSKCSSILVICYFGMGAKMWNVGDGDSESPIH